MTGFPTTVALIAQLVAGHTSPATLTTAGLVGVTLLLLAWALGRLASAPSVAVASGHRPRAAHTVFVRMLHPAAAGRPSAQSAIRRPRARLASR